LIIINEVLDGLMDFSAVEVVDYIMDDFPFRMAGFDEPIDYSYVFYRSL